MDYDSNNVFAKIIRKEIPTEIIYEDDYAMAFEDINPKAPVHILVVPKAMAVNFADFVSHSSDPEISGYMRAIVKVAEEAGLAENGYRLVFNTGANAGQEVPHLHVHILGGKKLSTDAL